MTVFFSPFAMSQADSDLMGFGFPVMGTILSALLLAGSSAEALERIKVMLIPLVTFGLVLCAVSGNDMLKDVLGATALWSIFLSTFWLSEILRQRAYRGDYKTSLVLLFLHEAIGLGIGISSQKNQELCVSLSVLYWFLAIVCYLVLWAESRQSTRPQPATDAPAPRMPL